MIYGKSGKMDLKLCSITTVKEDPKIIHRFINYHLNIGIEYMIFFLDDALLDYIKYFDPRVKIIITNREYWKDIHNCSRPDTIEERQLLNLKYGLELAKKKTSILIHLDIDELLYIEADKKLEECLQIFNISDIDVILPEILELYPRGLNTEKFYETAYFRKIINKRQVKKIIDNPKISNTIFYPEPTWKQYFRGHVNSKRLIKISDKIDFFTIHSVQLKHGFIKTHATSYLKILHFYSVNYNDWYTKWKRRIDGTGLASQMTGKRNAFQENFRAADKQNATEQLFIDTHCLKLPELPELIKLNIAQKIDLNPDLFKRKEN
jgi:hypothetical protein